MNWQQMLAAVTDRTFFGPMRPLAHRDRLARLRWAVLLRTPVLASWIRNDAWANGARRANDPDLWPVLALLLERYLLNLDTRQSQKELIAFWEWATADVPCERVRTLWAGADSEFQRTAWDKARALKDIDTQENRYVEIIERRLQALRQAAVRLTWAEEVLNKLALQRRPNGKGLNRSVARIIFAWDSDLPDELRPAILVDLELGEQCQLLPPRCEAIDPARPFDKRFKKVVAMVSRAVGAPRFHQLRYLSRPGFVGINDLPGQSLSGESGGLALFTTQRLANPGKGSRACQALPPWVCITARIGRESSGELSISKVAAIREKVEVLREEGVRVVVVADDDSQVEEANKSGTDAMKFVRCYGDAQSAVSTLETGRCTWPVDLSRYKPKEDVKGWSRRDVLAAVGVTVPVAAGLGYGGKALSDHLRRPTYSKTLALRNHNAAPMRTVAREIIGSSEKNPVAVVDFFRSHLHAGEVQVPPGDIFFTGLTLLEDSKLYDSTDWVKVARAEDVKRLPLEPAYYTRVMRLRKDDPRRTRILIAFDTGGFAVAPLPDPARPGDRVYYRLNKHMAESAGMLRTTYLDIDISNLGNDGLPFELVVRAVYFNGIQEQYHGRYASGMRKRWDWWGSRVIPGTEKADLAILLPERRGFRNVTYMLREEDETGKTTVPTFAVGKGDPEFEPAGSIDGSYTADNLCVWRIPCDLMAEAAVEMKQPTPKPWIFSIQWKWAA